MSRENEIVNEKADIGYAEHAGDVNIVFEVLEAMRSAWTRLRSNYRGSCCPFGSAPFLLVLTEYSCLVSMICHPTWITSI